MSSKVKLRAAIVVVVAFAIVLLSVPSSGAFDFVKDAFRVVRSEVHLALFMLQSNGDGMSRPLNPIVSVSSKDFIFIAHAAGEVNGKWVKNSVEGLNSSAAKGCQYMEMDFDWTTDQHLVSIHGWDSFFDEPLKGVMDLDTFMKRKRSDGASQMSFEDVDRWLLNHPNIKLITDVKSNNLKALGLFGTAKSYSQIIPQVYSFMEFSQARKIGFEKTILTTYKTLYSDSALFRFSEKASPAAITVPIFRLSAPLIVSMAEIGIPIFTHPVLRKSDLDQLPMGIKGVYSATLCK